jgi:cellulose biosynthesis protein BcsQ
MSVPVLTLFNNKSGVGKTSLVYHLSWMFAHFNKRVLAVDLDPQANLTAAFLDEDAIEKIWNDKPEGRTIFQCVKPLSGAGGILDPRLQSIAADLYLLPGDVGLSGFEDTLSEEWPNSSGTRNLYRPLRILSAFWRILQKSAEDIQADIMLIDIGPNLGAINRSVLIATDYVLIPLGADLFSFQGLKNLGPALRSWKEEWKIRLDNWMRNSESREHPDFPLPEGKMLPIGYLCQQYGVRLNRPVRADDKWAQRIPRVYREAVLNEPMTQDIKQEDDPYCLGIIKHYRSLVPIAQEHRKPIFDLTPADGAIGSHAGAVSDAKLDFEGLVKKIADKINLPYPAG